MFSNILVRAGLWPEYPMIKAVQAVIGTHYIMVDAALTRYALLHSYIWKTNRWIYNVFSFENLCFTTHNVVEAAKNICCAKIESAANHYTRTRWFKKFHLDYKNFDDHASSGQPKRVDSEALIKPIEANIVREYQPSLTFNCSGLFVIFKTLTKTSSWILPFCWILNSP